MALKVSFNHSASLAEQLEIAEQVRLDVIRAQRFAGETFVKDCREQVQSHEAGTYIDDTGNLRASIGYFIRENGLIIEQNISGSGDGSNAAVSALDDVPVKTGIQLVGLAGMNYASHVESKGYNVMSNQADFALVDLSDYYKTIEQKYKR